MGESSILDVGLASEHTSDNHLELNFSKKTKQNKQANKMSKRIKEWSK